MLRRLEVAEIVDEAAGARRADAGASVGTYIALATANRVVDPCSKLAFSGWWQKTAPRWVAPFTRSDAGRRRALDQPLAAVGLRTELLECCLELADN